MRPQGLRDIGKPATHTHEYFGHDEAVPPGSDRNFGLVFTGVFAVIALLPVLHGRPVRVWSLGVAAVVFGIAVFRPALLGPANRCWLALGSLLHRVTSPLVMGMLFFLVFLPMGLVMRAIGRDALRLRWDASAESYWIHRQPPGPEPDTMRHQF